MKAKPKSNPQKASYKELADKVEELELRSLFLMAALVIQNDSGSKASKAYREIITEITQAIGSESSVDKQDLIKRANKIMGL
jgi:hypothetical protein